MASLVPLRKKSGNLSNPASSVAKRRQRLWRTIKSADLGYVGLRNYVHLAANSYRAF